MEAAKTVVGSRTKDLVSFLDLLSNFASFAPPLTVQKCLDPGAGARETGTLAISPYDAKSQAPSAVSQETWSMEGENTRVTCPSKPDLCPPPTAWYLVLWPT